MQQLLTTVFLVVYSLTVLGVALVIITDNRNPLKTLPWILVLVLAPGAGLVIYFFFGQNLSKRRIISRRTRKRLDNRLEGQTADPCAVPTHHLPLMRLLERTAHAQPLGGSRIVPYIDGKSKMEALLEAIAGAKHHIHIQYYILCDDATGTRLRDALAAKARQGVQVRLLYDDVGCAGVKKPFSRACGRRGSKCTRFCTSSSRASQARSTTATTAR